uniref:Uncharacterized protein n=1 Tax=Nelumbo nucifera TaxID=4432 RepID=A0A822ZIY6_NELNU|nr:TPA_asm: hypothetical protein HUJ06_003332 [Nelumbo nucifera]
MPKFIVTRQRGCTINILHWFNRRMQVIKENSILSFKIVKKLAIDFVEFDI